MKGFVTAVLIMMSCLSISCKPTPVPRDKKAFLGQWKSNSGFTIAIKANGTADLTQNLSQADPEYDRLCIKVGPAIIKDMLVKFEGDSVVEISKPMVYAKAYKVDRLPSQDFNGFKMVMNGITLTK